ncbi:MAG TPA: peptidyl-alpha-hydroxyglycine alpha-amidating lyase family protein [Pyrinomonadaceae bacterium]|jgi:peptidylamidoglycolate lyase|nr:peptidyl-alpha-hydroxyglycine alpha-amidating lyase family protein [Pyrinomonadaceae bacterium]
MTKKIITAACPILVGLAVAFMPMVAAFQSKPSKTYGQSVHYQVVHGWPIVPDNTLLDEVSAVGVDSHGNVFVLMRGGRKWPDTGELDKSRIPVSTVYLFDGTTGKLLTKWGERLFALPHGLTVDAEDNVWITDVALQQVFKFSHDGRLQLTVGETGVAGNDSFHFNQPSGVAVLPNGSFYVSDGYINSRITKFSADGKFLLSWGTKGKADGQFDLPHSVAIDHLLNVYVVDRANKRIQVFDGNGNFLRKFVGPPFILPQDIKIAADGTMFMTETGNEDLPDRSGVLVLRRDGTQIGRIGSFGNYDGQFEDPHWIAIGKNGEIYVADFTGRRVQKFVLSRRRDR